MPRGQAMAPFTNWKRAEEAEWLEDDLVLFAKRDDDDNDGKKKGGRPKERDDSGGDSDDDSSRSGNGGGNGGKNGGNGDGNKNKSSGSDSDSDDDRKNKNNNKNNGGNSNNNNGGNNNSPPPPPPPPPQQSFPPPVTVTTTSIPESTIVVVSTVTSPVTPSTTSTSSSTTSSAPSVTSFAPLLTTGVIPFAPEISTQPRKGVDGPDTTSFTVGFASRTLSAGTAGTALADTLPTSSSTGNGNNNKDDGGKHKNDKNKGDKQSGLDQTAEHVLISVGSIGSFILVCFIVWIVWRTMKKSRRAKNHGDMGGDGFRSRILPSRLVARVPFLRPRGWENLDDSGVSSMPPPVYREKASVAGLSQVEGYYAQEKMYQQMDMAPQIPIPGISRSNTLNSQFTGGMNLNTNMGLGPGAMQTGSPVSVHQAVPTFSSVDAAQFGTMSSSDGSGTARSRMPDAFYNQSELSRQPSDAYDPARRQVNRVSELSSISSGFGDGDIIVPDSYLQPPKPASTNMRQSSNLVGRFSWMSQGRRDTVYTQNSEDSPPRFRSVTSWVNQQTGRIKRVQQKETDPAAPPVPQLPGQVGVPGIHNPPTEQSFGMMMEDNEIPRPVQETITNRKPAS